MDGNDNLENLVRSGGLKADRCDHMRRLLAQLSRSSQYPLQRGQLLANHFLWPGHITDPGEVQQPLARRLQRLVAHKTSAKASAN